MTVRVFVDQRAKITPYIVSFWELTRTYFFALLTTLLCFFYIAFRFSFLSVVFNNSILVGQLQVSLTVYMI